MKTYSSFKKQFILEPYVIQTDLIKRRNITKLRISCHSLTIETGRYSNPKIPIDKRVCIHCNLNCIENEYHVIVECPFYSQERNELFTKLSEFTTLNCTPSNDTFEIIINMANGDPEIIDLVCSFIDACFDKKQMALHSL